MKRCSILTLAFLLFVSIAHAQIPTYQIAVTPYANIGADKTADYIGFQIAEFLSSAMAGFPGVQVIERTQLMKILEEQELQLSGITEGESSVSVGQILNARQMVVGSFELTKTRLVVNGRIVDVQSGAVLSRASIETPRADSYLEAYKAFMFKLLSELPEYKLTIGVEARIENIAEQASAGADDYAKALAALYNKDDTAALEYLEKALGGTQVGFVGFGSASDRYVETLSRVRGSSRYAKMVQKQIETNKALMDQVEPLSIYRATLKVLESRIKGALAPDAFVIDGDPAEAVEYDDGLVSTTVRLPGVAGVMLKDGAREAIASLFTQQDVVKLGKSGLTIAQAPRGGLLSPAILDREFNLNIRASIAHSVQFVSVKGDVLYELVSDPIPIVQLSPTSANFQSTGKAVYRTIAYREGWAVHADGRIEIQARALADLDTVRYVIQPGSISVESSFGLASDLRWRSLITHAYRKYSIKVASQAEDSAPQFKDVVITDAFFTTADPSLGPVPMLPRNDMVAGYARLTAVVYFADNVKDAVTATWKGTVTGDSKPYVGEVGPNTVLYFEAPGSYAMRFGPAEFTARLGQAPTGKTALVTLGNGGSWYTGNSVYTYYLRDDTVYTSRGELLGLASAADRRDETTRGKTSINGYEIFLLDDSVLLLHRNGLTYLDPATGAEQRSVKFDFGNVYDACLVSGKVYVRADYGLGALDAATGVQLWKVNESGQYGLTVVFGRVYSDSGTVYDASTGTKLFSTEGRGWVTVTGDKALWSNGLCADRETGVSIWKYFNPEKRKSWSSSDTQGIPIVSGDTVYFGAGAAVRLEDGIPLWTIKDRPTRARLANGRLFGWTGDYIAEYDPGTGNRLWYISSGLNMDPRAVQYHDGFLYASFSTGGLTRIDLSVLSHELDALAMAKRGNLNAYLQYHDGYSEQPRGVQVANIITGGAAEKAGILPGDYIVGFTGRKFSSTDQLIDQVYQTQAGQRVAMIISRFEPQKYSWETKTMSVVMGGPLDGVARPGFTVKQIARDEIVSLKADSVMRRGWALAIDTVLPGSPAEKAGMAAGDVLITVGGEDLGSKYYESDLYKALNAALAKATQSRSTLNLTVLRNGEKKTLPPFRP